MTHPSFSRVWRMASVMLSAVLFSTSPALPFEQLDFTVIGENGQLETALERASLLRAARDEGITDAFEVFTIARAEYGQLIGLFYESGFYAPEISVLIDGREAADISPLNPPAVINTVQIVLTPGPAFVFGRTDLGPVAPETGLPDGFMPGEIARSTVIRDATRVAVESWRDAGHAKAEPTDQQISARHPPGVLDVAVQITPGPRLRFGTLRPAGQQRTRPQRIVKIAGLPTGEVFSPAEVERAARRLRRTGTFASVAIREAEEPNPDGTLDMNVTVVEAPLRRIGASVEVDTEAGGKLTGFWLHRNLLGGAERFRVEGRVSGVGARGRGRGGRRGGGLDGLDYRLGVEFSRPATFTPDTDLNLGAFVETENDRDFEAERVRADIGLVHRFNDELTFGAGVGFLLERARVGPELEERRTFEMVLFPLNVTWDRRDDERTPTSGFFVRGEVMPFLGLEGTDSGARAYTDLRSYLSFGEDDRVVLAGQFQAGAVIGSRLDSTPRDLLFYSGGSGTVRGQPFRSLGATSPTGVRSGGQGFAALAVEARVRATQSIGLVAFVDTGYVSEGAFTGSSDYHAGAGLGVRYETPVGPLRLDVGFPVAGPTGRGAQLYLGIGHAF